MPRYESHITVDRQHAPIVKAVAENHGFVYSEIAGCPILGQGTYCYLTGYATNARELRTRVQRAADVLTSLHVEPLRLKIERIVWDTKTGVDEIGGAVQCPSKHDALGTVVQCNLTKGHKGKHEHDESMWSDEMAVTEVKSCV
jgi:hypothetical protein